MSGVFVLRGIYSDKVTFEDLHQLLEGHRGDHGRVAQGLQFHVPAVMRAFELQHNQASVPVHTQQVDTAIASFEVAELLGYDQEGLIDRADVVS
jgi:hypothetical protein